MIVLDASSAVLALTDAGEARRRLRSEAMVAPPHIDLEVASTLRNHVRRGVMESRRAQDHLVTWMDFGVRRLPVTRLLPRIWELRDNLTAYDAAYVALAEVLECDLLTSDARIAGAPGPRCTISVVRT